MKTLKAIVIAITTITCAIIASVITGIQTTSAAEQYWMSANKISYIDFRSVDYSLAVTKNFNVSIDTNNDAKNNIMDLIRMYKYVLGNNDAVIPGRGDANNDGVINAEDIIILKNLLTGRITALESCKAYLTQDVYYNILDDNSMWDNPWYDPEYIPCETTKIIKYKEYDITTTTCTTTTPVTTIPSEDTRDSTMNSESYVTEMTTVTTTPVTTNTTIPTTISTTTTEMSTTPQTTTTMSVEPETTTAPTTTTRIMVFTEQGINNGKLSKLSVPETVSRFKDFDKSWKTWTLSVWQMPYVIKDDYSFGFNPDEPAKDQNEIDVYNAKREEYIANVKLGDPECKNQKNFYTTRYTTFQMCDHTIMIIEYQNQFNWWIYDTFYRDTQKAYNVFEIWTVDNETGKVDARLLGENIAYVSTDANGNVKIPISFKTSGGVRTIAEEGDHAINNKTRQICSLLTRSKPWAMARIDVSAYTSSETWDFWYETEFELLGE